jgi:hypothetical protein
LILKTANLKRANFPFRKRSLWDRNEIGRLFLQQSKQKGRVHRLLVAETKETASRVI